MENISVGTVERAVNPQRQDLIYNSLGIGVRDITPPTTTSGKFPEKFGKDSRSTYAFTTENIGDYLVELPILGQSVLSVAGSSDFPINAYRYPPRKVDAVDVSPVACYFGELKLAGLSELSYEEFLGFFGTNGNQAFGQDSFSHSQYGKLRPLLSEHAQTFFDEVMPSEGRHPFLGTSPGQMIIDKFGSMEIFKEYNPYLQNADTYEQVRRTNKKVQFSPQDMQETLESGREKYDLIHMSNIMEYPPFRGNEKARRKLLGLARGRLNKNGRIFVYMSTQGQHGKEMIEATAREFKAQGFICMSFSGRLPHTKGDRYIGHVLTPGPFWQKLLPPALKGDKFYG